MPEEDDQLPPVETETPPPESTETPPAETTPPAPVPTPPWAAQRIETVTRQFRDAERQSQAHAARIAELEAKLAGQTPPAGTTPAPAPAPANLSEAQINERAAQIAENVRFNETCDTIARAGKTQFPDFQKSVEAWGTYIGGIPQAVIEGAQETDNPARVIYELGKDMEEATRIARLSPARQAAAVARYSAKLPDLEDPKPKVAGGTATPALPKPLTARVGSTAGGGAKGETRLDDDTSSISDWMKRRNADLKRA